MPRHPFAIGLGLLAASPLAQAAATGPALPIDFILFGLTLLGVALFHAHTLKVALGGLTAIVTYKWLWTGFAGGAGALGLLAHLRHEWVVLANLFLLLMGFALLSKHFEDSHAPEILPNHLPDDWRGGFMLLLFVFVLSAFLDNIAAALIGGATAHALYQGRVHIGFLAAIVAAANAGGAGSVVGDTTTTMMWIAGVHPLQVAEAFIAAAVALATFGFIAAHQQHRHQPIMRDTPPGLHLDRSRIAIVLLVLLTAVSANVMCNLYFPAVLDAFPVLGAAVWCTLLLSAGWRRPDWSLLPATLKGTVFLLALVLCASLMPVEQLPSASWPTTLGLGFVSAVFDNIPLTALAIKQGGYDWGFLAYAVGFGGSMVWFGSSAGVAISNMYPEARSVGLWLRHGWHVALAYVVGFLVLLALLGWHPQPMHGRSPHDATVTPAMLH